MESAGNAARRRGRRPNSEREALIHGVIKSEVPEKEELRPPVRPEPRSEDPRIAAARRAAEIRGHLGSMDDGTDEFWNPPAPDGWTYEWKARFVTNEERTSYMTSLHRMGWDPVPASRHPEMMPEGGAYANIERKGMILMERPTVIVEESREIERMRARSQVTTKESQLSSAPKGTLERGRPTINKGYEPIPVPKD